MNEAKDFAVRLGIAVQWVNILRDIGYDTRMNRVYLPLDHLEQFGYTMDDLFAHKNSAEFQNLVHYEAQVARSHFSRAMELLPTPRHRELLPARIMGRIYFSLLEKIERENFPVLERKVRLSLFEKGKAVWASLKEPHA